MYLKFLKFWVRGLLVVGQKCLWFRLIINVFYVYVYMDGTKCWRLQPEKLWACEEPSKSCKEPSEPKMFLALCQMSSHTMGPQPVICLWGCTRTKLQVQMKRLDVSLRTALIPICFHRSPLWTQRWCRNSPRKMRKSITGSACRSNTRRGRLKSCDPFFFLTLCSLPSYKSHGESAVFFFF